MALLNKHSDILKKLDNNIDENIDTENIQDNGDDLLDNNESATEAFSVGDINFGENPLHNDESSDIQKEPENFFFDMGGVTLLNNTTIYFNCFVEKHTVDDAIRCMKQVNHNIATIELEYPELKGKVEFKFVINSNGGNVVQGLRLFDAIQANPYPITTIASGMAASMGIILTVAGKKKAATKNSVLMIHQLSAGAQGKFMELQDYMRFWTSLQDVLKGILVDNTNAKEKDIEKFMKGETFIMAPEALKLGLIDEIVNL
jgi:ATP-dependent Clp endopeptidase proteolytic subunit ClpP